MRTTLAAALAGLSLLAACGAPSPGPADAVAAQPAAVRAAPAPAPAECTQSYAPGGSVAELRSGPSVQAIIKKKRLVVGTSGVTLLWAARNPKNGRLEGFDIQLAEQLAKAIGVPIEYKVITFGQRIDRLQKDTVDVVLHTMTINCARWEQIAFSAVYYNAGKRLLVREDGPASIDQLAAEKKNVCATTGSTSLEYVEKNFPDLARIAVSDLGECLVRFQQGEVDAIAGDDAVLAGFAAQDPYAKIVGNLLTAEPYGIGVNKDRQDLVRFVNAVLADVEADGTWAKIYASTMGTAVPGAAPKPPAATYGR